MSRYRTVKGGYRNSYTAEDYYFDGNTVRKSLELIETVRPLKKRKKQETELVEQPKTHPHTLSLGFVLFLMLMLAVLMAGCIYYLGLRNDLTEHQSRITELESELSSLRTKNDEEYDRIMGSVDMEEVKRIAMDDLGMTYPGADQVVGISGTGGDYVRQYKDIPRDGRK